MLRRADGRVFTPSWVRYTDALPVQPRRGDPKVYVRIAVGSPLSRMLAMVDTGAAYSVLDASVAQRLGAFDDAGVPQVELSTRFGLLRGHLVRRDTWLLAEEGKTLAIEATFWVSPDWHFGHILGYSGFLERIRFALDPPNNRFHFGAIEG